MKTHAFDSIHRSLSILTAAAVSLGFVATTMLGGCADGDPPLTQDKGKFVSANPTAQDYGTDNTTGPVGSSAGAGGGSQGTSATTGGDPAPPDDPSLDPERLIAEADIIQVEGDVLYALSQYGGLSVIDVSTRDELTLLGRYQVTGVPFEMYLRDGLIYAMYSSWVHYMWDEVAGHYRTEQSSRVEVLDVSQPAQIAQVGSFDLPGAISDSRIVGDVLYAVSFEDGYCYGCKKWPNTTITSLNVADPSKIAVADQLSYSDKDSYAWGWRRSISVTTERMYVAGVEYGGGNQGKSTIQVVDISDSSGKLVEGASVEAAGQITSRWQMNEHEGILRVISQPGMWWQGDVPRVQTFTVNSAQDVTPLGSLDMVLPEPETLRSVRFDGTRAYAITAQQTDPLFIIDLSDPATPKQLGELEIPGWVYHMEPRGDRLLALGFDNQHPDGALNVSLFNVAEMSNPTLIERVHFGGDWGNFAEDQDRIHKAFTILDELGLIMVPYSGYSWQDQQSCPGYASGIQLVDFTKDSLTLRGIAESRGNARRAFMHDDRLFAVSDHEVRTFDIADRSKPKTTSSLALSTQVHQTVIVGDHVARLSADWWTSSTMLDVVTAADPTQAQPIGSIDLTEVRKEFGCGGYYGVQLFAHDKQVYLVWSSNDYGSEPQSHVAVIDLSDPSAPRLGGTVAVPAPLHSYDVPSMLAQSGKSIVQFGSTLVFRRTKMGWHEYDYGYEFDQSYGSWEAVGGLHHTFLEVVDLSSTDAPKHAATVELPIAGGQTLLDIEGSTVLTTHWVPLGSDHTKARFYLDRVDVAAPAKPIVHASVNIPGTILDFDSDVSRVMTVDYSYSTAVGTSYAECRDQFGYADMLFEPYTVLGTDDDSSDSVPLGVCRGLERSFRLVDIESNEASLIDSRAIAVGTYLGQPIRGEGRVFMRLSQGSPYSTTDAQLAVLAAEGDQIQMRSLDALAGSDYLLPLAAVGTRLIAVDGYAMLGLRVIDTSDLDALEMSTTAPLRAYLHDLTVNGDSALCSLGSQGVQSVKLSD